MRVPHFDISPDGTRLIAVGGFSKVGGASRTQVAQLDLTTTPVSVANWSTNDFPVLDPADTTLTWCSPNFPTWVRDVEFSPEWVVLRHRHRRREPTQPALRHHQPMGERRDRREPAPDVGQLDRWGLPDLVVHHRDRHLHRWPPAVGEQPLRRPELRDLPRPRPWRHRTLRDRRPRPDQRTTAVVEPRTHPRTRHLGVLATPDGLWQGSDSDTLGGETHRKLGFFPLQGGTPVPANHPYALANDFYTMSMATGALTRRNYDLTTFGPATTVPTGVDWRDTRGAFVLNDKLYTGWSNGNLYVRPFDGASAGSATEVNLHGLETPPPSVFTIPGTTTRIPGMTSHLLAMSGMFYHHGRIYYTVAGDTRLYYRYFTPRAKSWAPTCSWPAR